MSESGIMTTRDKTREGEWALGEWWSHVRLRHVATAVALIVAVAGMVAKIAYGRRTDEIELLRQQVVQVKSQLADARKEIDTLRKPPGPCENWLGDPDAGSGTVCHDSSVSGRPRIDWLIQTLKLGNRIRWTIIERYGTGWTRKNGEGRFQALEAEFDALKEEATRSGLLWQEYVISGLFDRLEDRETITRLYAEFHLIDVALTEAFRDRDPEQTCAQLARWRTSNAEYMRLASRRLVELVHDAFLQPSTGGPCLVDQYTPSPDRESVFAHQPS